MNKEQNNNELVNLPDDVVLSVRGVSKKFCRNLRRSMLYGMQDLGRDLLGLRPKTTDHRPQTVDLKEETKGHRLQSDSDSLQSPVSGLQSDSSGLRPSEFWALRDISFDLKRGEVLGLIGPNGSGKTTLLRLLTGIFPPDAGEISIRGRVGALISLGAGFHPHMTGRENIYLNGTILGMTREEIAAKFDEIVDFAEIGESLDAPVATYSSGMRVKLGFAIAIKINADLLLIDEVLAVGDMGFRIKCLNAMRRIMNNTAVIFVSHTMQLVSQFCTRIAVMNQGVFACDTASIAEGVDCYLTQFPTETATAGTGGAIITNVQLRTKDRSWQGEEEATILQGEELNLLFDVKMIDLGCKTVRFTVHIMDQGFDPIIVLVPSEYGHFVREATSGSYRVRIGMGIIDLNAGKYHLVISIENIDTFMRLIRVEGQGRFRVISDMVHWCRIRRLTDLHIEHI